MTQGVYAIRCSPTGDVYVGSSRDIAARWRQHEIDLGAGRHCNSALQSRWSKYGEAAFEFEILEVVDSRSALPIREQSWIDRIGTLNRRPAAESAAGVDWEWSDEALERSRLRSVDHLAVMPFAEDNVIARWRREGRRPPIKGRRSTYSLAFKADLLDEMERIKRDGLSDYGIGLDP